MRISLALLTVLLVACGAEELADNGDSDAQWESQLAPAGAWPPPGRLLPLNLQRVAVAPPVGQPTALAYLPKDFDPSLPLHVLVYFHGWNNCVQNVVRPVGAPCTAGGPARSGFDLANQLEASGRNAILLLPELSFDRQSSSAGHLEEAGYFRALLYEALGALKPYIGARAVTDVAGVLVASHSGGYNAAAAVTSAGQVPVTEIALFDSLYARDADFLSFLQRSSADLGSQPWNGRRRFLSVYTDGGGTATDNRALAGQAAGLGLPSGAVQDDRTTSTWDSARYLHGVLFKRSALSHDGTARYYLQRLLSTSRVPMTRPPNS